MKPVMTGRAYYESYGIRSPDGAGMSLTRAGKRIVVLAIYQTRQRGGD